MRTVAVTIFATLGVTFFLVLSTTSAESPTPTRTVKGQTLISKEMPALSITFDKAFKYAGAQSFVLYNVANAEQHFFVDADKESRIKRFYWVQFEGYLPTNTHSYDYKANKLVNLGGLDFIADAFPRNVKNNPGRPDSDGVRAYFSKARVTGWLVMRYCRSAWSI